MFKTLVCVCVVDNCILRHCIAARDGREGRKKSWFRTLSLKITPSHQGQIKKWHTIWRARILWAKWQEGTATWRTNDRECSDLSTTSLKEALGNLYYWRTFAFPYLYRAADTTVISIPGKLLGFQGTHDAKEGSPAGGAHRNRVIHTILRESKWPHGKQPNFKNGLLEKLRIEMPVVSIFFATS